jgi:hypothetical protein
MEIVFELNRALKDVDNHGDIYLGSGGREHLVKMKFGLPTKFMSNHWLHVPLEGEDCLVTLLKFLEGPFKPGEPPLGVVEG